MLDSICHMTLSRICHQIVIILSLCTQRFYERHNASRKSETTIGITQVFLWINICWIPRVVLKPEPERWVF